MLDALDRKILFQLDADARQPLSALARKLHIARERLEYRVDRLRAQGIIKQSTVTINPYRLGLTIYKTYVTVNKGSKRYHELRRALNQHPRVYWIAECDGRWDLIYALFARTPYEFHSLQSEILNRYRDAIIGFNVYTLINVWMFGKNYLVGSGDKSFLVGGAPQHYPLDEIEWRILERLSHDARESVPQIAQQLNSTEMVVRHRIKKMEDAGLIAGYRIELDYTKIGMNFFKAQLYLNASSRSQIAKFKAFCSAHPHITYYIEQIGECELELEIEVDGYSQFTTIINEIRTQFAEVIRNVETVLVHRAWFRWVPFEVARG